MKSFPSVIPIFPLSGVIYFPKTNLPLNIFEQRYLDLVNDTYENNKLMGMVQSQRNGNQVYKIGCLGRISDLQKSEDGRILINLTGVTRFKILEEVENKKLYREFKVDYKGFEIDLKDPTGDLDTDDLMHKAKKFFKCLSQIFPCRCFFCNKKIPNFVETKCYFFSRLRDLAEFNYQSKKK